MSDESRKQFELWAISRYGENYVHLDLSTMKYDVQLIQSHWECWKESRAALVVEQWDFDTFSPNDCGDEAVWMTEVKRTLGKAGITVKGEGE